MDTAHNHKMVVSAKTAEILKLVPAQYEKCAEGIRNAVGDLVITTDEAIHLEPCDEDQRAEYAAMQADQQSAAMDYEDAVQAKIRQLAVDALHAEGIDPPAAAKKLYLDKGKITDKKPTAVAID